MGIRDIYSRLSRSFTARGSVKGGSTKGIRLISSRVTKLPKGIAAVSCSPVMARLGGVGLGSGTTGNLGRAWHQCMGGAWHGCRVLVGWEGAWPIYEHLFDFSKTLRSFWIIVKI